ncbi:hypothetical protein QP615_14405 [Providencia rettgeri]|nr:hypothetical protein [Providencia rettgeri]MDK7744905.1 hypothetical protein [Providencia rettgeri]MDK7758777.1 hypothetical protein [Providencia rettgeri]
MIKKSKKAKKQKSKKAKKQKSKKAKKQKKYTKKDLLALKHSLKINSLEMIPYLKFLDIILSLQENELKKAYFLVNEIKESELPQATWLLL